MIFISCDAFKLKPRILNGYSSERGQFPYYAYLKVNTTIGFIACGGTLINEDWIVTAAHCIQDANLVVVHLGLLSVHNMNDDGVIVLNVSSENFYTHPNYDDHISLDDIGLIQLPHSVEFTETIRPITLEKNCISNLEDSIDVIAIGNGILNETSRQLSPILQWAPLKTISLDKCRLSHPFIFYRKSVVCANSINPNRSVCKGDSGGPLIHSTETGDDILVGISSFIHLDGCDQQYPQVFSKIWFYCRWITEITDITLPKC